MQKILTVEICSDELVEMHFNKQGAAFLRDKLNVILEKNENLDFHLMTSEWGGNELSSERQNDDPLAKLVNHLKLFYWK